MKTRYHQILLSVFFGIILSSCGSTATNQKQAATVRGDCLANGAALSIDSEENHGHALDIPPADISAAVDKTYDITGSADHSQSITITGAEFASLQANQDIWGTSSAAPDLHTHFYVVQCKF